jgi:hypothetical protein
LSATETKIISTIGEYSNLLDFLHKNHSDVLKEWKEENKNGLDRGTNPKQDQRTETDTGATGDCNNEFKRRE